MKLVQGYSHQRSVAAVNMNPEHFKALAAIRFARSAGGTSAAKVIGLDGAKIARPDATPSRSGNHLHAELMAHDARVSEERLFARIGMHVRAAHAASTHANEGFVCRGNRLGNIQPREQARFFKANGFHNNIKTGAIALNRFGRQSDSVKDFFPFAGSRADAIGT